MVLREERRRLRILAIVDDFSRECLTLVVDTSLGRVRAVCELNGDILACFLRNPRWANATVNTLSDLSAPTPGPLVLRQDSNAKFC
jgi:hypothetical protein